RIANEVLNRAATMYAVEAAESTIFEIRCSGEAARYAILNQAQLEMTRDFLAQLQAYESFRGQASPEVIDTMKARALDDFTTRMNRTCKADVEFSKSEILRLDLKP